MKQRRYIFKFYIISVLIILAAFICSFSVKAQLISEVEMTPINFQREQETPFLSSQKQEMDVPSGALNFENVSVVLDDEQFNRADVEEPDDVGAALVENEQLNSPNEIANNEKIELIDDLTPEDRRNKLVDVRNEGFNPVSLVGLMFSMALLAIMIAPQYKKSKRKK